MSLNIFQCLKFYVKTYITLCMIQFILNCLNNTRKVFEIDNAVVCVMPLIQVSHTKPLFLLNPRLLQRFSSIIEIDVCLRLNNIRKLYRPYYLRGGHQEEGTNWFVVKDLLVTWCPMVPLHEPPQLFISTMYCASLLFVVTIRSGDIENFLWLVNIGCIVS